MKWITKDGCQIEISDMKTSHIVNAKKMLERDGNDVCRFGFFGSETADNYYDETENPIYVALTKELKKRKTVID